MISARSQDQSFQQLDETTSLNNSHDLCRYLSNAYIDAANTKTHFKFKEVYQTLTQACTKLNINLQDVRVSSDNYSNGFTLLHLMIICQDVDAVREILNATHPAAHIPRNVEHYSTNHLLHYCGLAAKKDDKHTGTPSLNFRMIEIAKLLSDPTAPNFLPLDTTVCKPHADGGHHVHSAAMSGAGDVLQFFVKNSRGDAMQQARNDGARPIDFAQKHNHLHIIQWHQSFVTSESKPQKNTASIKRRLQETTTKAKKRPALVPVTILSHLQHAPNNSSSSSSSSSSDVTPRIASPIQSTIANQDDIDPFTMNLPSSPTIGQIDINSFLSSSVDTLPPSPSPSPSIALQEPQVVDFSSLQTFPDPTTDHSNRWSPTPW